MNDCNRTYELVKGVLYYLIKYNLPWSHEPLVSIAVGHMSYVCNVIVTGVLAPTAYSSTGPGVPDCN